MELEGMFSEQKWNILKSLSEERYSPLQLAQKLNTTIANISQQLRLLEAANLVKTEKIPSRDKGKPRKLFSLRHDYAYLIPAMKDFANKRLLELNDHHKAVLRIWFLENSELHYPIEKFYWQIEPYLEQIKAIAVSEKEGAEVILVVTKIKDIEKKVSSLAKELKSKKINVKLFSEQDAKRLISNRKAPFASINELVVVYDAGRIFKNKSGGG